MPKNPSTGLPEKTKITPVNPEAIAEILIKRFYTNPHERTGLVRDLLASRSGKDIAKVLMSKDGRRRLGDKLRHAVELVAVWAPILDCIKVYSQLGTKYEHERLILLEKIVELSVRLIDEEQYRKFFTGAKLLPAELRVLELALGTGLLARLILPEDKIPNLFVVNSVRR
jgi:hypothetical protein